MTHIFEYALEARIIDRNYAKEFYLDKKVFQEKEDNHKEKNPFTEDELKKLWKSIEVGQNESAKYWLGVLNSLKNRGVQDILILCADGLSGIKEAINTAFSQTE